jgi:hypothetical protein
MVDYHYERPEWLEELFPKNVAEDQFNMKRVYAGLADRGEKPKKAVDVSIDNHMKQIIRNSEDYYDALELVDHLKEEIEYRCRLYCSCLHNATESYSDWLKETYIRKLKNGLRLEMM